MIKNPYFFGYGSLVNRATHEYPNAAHATANGWRRAWVDTAVRPHAYLTSVRAPGVQIAGLIAEVPGGDWAALDEREDAYDRIHESDCIDHTHPHASDIAIYAVPPHASSHDQGMPILLSYLDVVLQGYLQEFGRGGAEAFLDTTAGWSRPVLNDRKQPQYPRHQKLADTETDFVDSALNTLKIDVIPG